MDNPPRPPRPYVNGFTIQQIVQRGPQKAVVVDITSPVEIDVCLLREDGLADMNAFQTWSMADSQIIGWYTGGISHMSQR